MAGTLFPARLLGAITVLSVHWLSRACGTASFSAEALLQGACSKCYRQPTTPVSGTQHVLKYAHCNISDNTKTLKITYIFTRLNKAVITHGLLLSGLKPKERHSHDREGWGTGQVIFKDTPNSLYSS